MNAEIRTLFHELADLPPVERERIFRERPISEEIRAEVESLLGHDSTDAQDLSQRVSVAAEELLRSARGADPTSCGPYRLVRMLGEGGMGTVYLAERTDGEIEQRVAVKLLGGRGLRNVWRDRFLKERQLQALLHHPSIVHVIDAGHTEDGRPYLVMEYVEGVPIDEYAGRLELRERLMLFLRVCEGVSHAHQHLIIHRDLKPSNILVDESAQPKLLDFGIAKLLDETGDPTRTMERLLTPNYASPEQLRAEVQTTATDVYSLGAVLYKLLTGRSPHESETHASEALEVMTGTREIPRPSALNESLPKDLDYILRKALRNEPEARYVSVEAFAADVRAFLESRPVEARSGNTWYRTRKFLRRYWMPVVAALLAIVSLSVGWYVANRARVVAERRFQQLRQLSNKIFDLDKTIQSLPGSIPARQKLVSTSLEYLEGLSADARGDLDLAREVGEGYWRVAMIQGVPVALNLGQREKAEISLKKADALMETVLAARPKDGPALLRSATIAEDRMILAQEDRQNAEAQAYARKATQRLDEFLQMGEVGDAARDEAAGIYKNVALAYVNMHLYALAIPCARRSVDLVRSIPSARPRVSEGLSLLASALRYQGDLEGALRTIEEARKIADQAVYANATERVLSQYGILLREGYILGEENAANLGREGDAIAALQKAFDTVEELARKDPHDAVSRSRVANSGIALGNILRQQYPERAIAVYDRALFRLGEMPDNRTNRREQALMLANSSYAFRGVHREAEAQNRVDRAMAILRETKDFPAEQMAIDSVIFTALCAAADQEAEAGDPHRAVADYEQILDRVMAGKPDPLNDLRDAPHMSRLYEVLARLYRRTGEIPEAEKIESRRLELWQQWKGKLPDNAYVRRELEASRLP